jgi:rhamnosyltransferase
MTEMPNANALAVVVTYNPDADLSRNLAALRLQFAHVLVVDNGSANVEPVRVAATESGCVLVCNSTNFGIARALNQGVEALLAGSFGWLATFDQDSLLPDGGIDGLFATCAAYPAAERIGIMAMAHRDRGTGRDYHHRVDILEEEPAWRLLRATITSGSMVRREVFEQVGRFEDDLFIDAVDHEFCLRVRRHGWLIVEARAHVMAHSIGATTVTKVLGLPVVCTHHSPLRRYYMVRNHLEVCRRNILFDPAWSFKAFAQAGSGALAAVLCEQRKLAKLRAVLLGLAHFMLRRFGPL